MSLTQVSLFLFWLGFGLHLWGFDLFLSGVSSLEGLLFFIAALLLMLNRSLNLAIILGCIASVLGIMDGLFNYGIFSSFENFLYLLVEIASGTIFFQAAFLQFKDKSLFSNSIEQLIPSLKVSYSLTCHNYNKDKDKLFIILNLVSMAITIVISVVTLLYTIALIVTFNSTDKDLINLFYQYVGYVNNITLFITLVGVNIFLIITAIMLHLAKKDSRYRVVICGFYASIVVSFVFSISSGFNVIDLLVLIYTSVAVYSGLIAHFLDNTENSEVTA